jgi:hypothetical protein
MIKKRTVQLTLFVSTLSYWSNAFVPGHSTCDILRRKNIKSTSFFIMHESSSESNYETHSLMDLLMPDQKCNPTQMSPTALAYVGDSVFELFVRSRYVWPSRRTTDLQNIVVGRVRGEIYVPLDFFNSAVACLYVFFSH